MIPVENIEGEAFLDAEKMADVLDSVALTVEDWDMGFEIIRGAYWRHGRESTSVRRVRWCSTSLRVFTNVLQILLGS